MMLTHKWLEYYRNTRPGLAEVFTRLIRGAVQFDCGLIDDIPVGKAREFFEAKAPFPSTLLQFEYPSNDNHLSHAIVLWRDQEDGSVLLICAQKLGMDWFVCAETRITRNDDGSFHYERHGAYERNTDIVMRLHAYALNVFYIIGCSNVELADNKPPAALNKKRAKAGKLPLFEYKTLVLKVGKVAAKSSAGGGTHASPRVHLRRGHVRRLDAERRVWVQACVVGSGPGMIHKDYRVDGDQ